MRKSVAVKSSPLTWLCRALWLSVPLLLGDVFTTRLIGTSRTATIVWEGFLWALWALVVVAMLVQLPRSLTIVRMLVPLAPLLGIVFWSTATEVQRPGVVGMIGLVVALIVAALAMSADVGADFIDGASYGDERRQGLNPPVFLLVGPIQALWLGAAVPSLVSVTLLASSRWLPGGIAAVIAIVMSWYAFRLLHRLSERCVVLVPAGLTLVDPLSLTEPTLFRRDDIVRLGPAVIGSEQVDGVADLTVGAPGLVVSLEFSRPLSIVPVAERGRVTEPVEVTSVLIAPSRPGRMLDLAQKRRITVGRD